MVSENWKRRNDPLVYKDGHWYYEDGKPAFPPGIILRQGNTSDRCDKCHSSLMMKNWQSFLGLKYWVDAFFYYPKSKHCIQPKCPNYYKNFKD